MAHDNETAKNQYHSGNEAWFATTAIDNLHLSQKLLKQHLLVSTASFITSLHKGQCSSGGRSPTECVDGIPSISFSKAAL